MRNPRVIFRKAQEKRAFPANPSMGEASGTKARTNFLDLDKIARSGQCFRWEPAGPGAYIIPAFGRSLRVRQTGINEMEADCAPAEWDAVWAAYFDWDTDYAAICERIDPADASLRAAAEAARGVRILRQELWETLISFIISQNNNIPRIKRTLKRLCERFGGFPKPEALAGCGLDALREDGLGYRAPYLISAAAQFIADGPLPPGRAFEDDRATLMTYAGVGPKVADCVCLFGLGHKEAFPVDTWVRRVVKQRYQGRFPLERYPGCAGVMQQFLFFAEREGALVQPAEVCYNQASLQME